MGDRANVRVVAGSSEVFLYTHSEGTELPTVVQSALQRSEDRWDDDQYLTRVIFSEMIKDDIDGTTGFGITSDIRDRDDRIITVDVDKQTVSFSTHKVVASFTEFVDNDANPSW